jgi:hypothetical protein
MYHKLFHEVVLRTYCAETIQAISKLNLFERIALGISAVLVQTCQALHPLQVVLHRAIFGLDFHIFICLILRTNRPHVKESWTRYLAPRWLPSGAVREWSFPAANEGRAQSSCLSFPTSLLLGSCLHTFFMTIHLSFRMPRCRHCSLFHCLCRKCSRSSHCPLSVLSSWTRIIQSVRLTQR